MTEPAAPGVARRAWVAGLWAALLVIVVATAAALVLLFPWGGAAGTQGGFSGPPEDRFPGEIVGVTEALVQDDFLLPGAVSVTVDVRLDDGRRLSIESVDEAGIFSVGRRVEVAQISAPGTPELWAIVDLPRGAPLTGLAVLFVLAVVALGRWQGVRALVGLGISAVLIVGFLVPALLDGQSPTVLALVTATAVMLVTLPLSHGLSRIVLAAIVGTTLALGLTVGLAVLAVDLTGLTGLASEDVQMVRFSTSQAVDLRGLLLAGMIVGTLGVLDDVTVSQASTVAALHRADPTMRPGRLFTEALSVGRDHIAATVNTLFLAYAGAALPLLILFVVGQGGLGEVLTSELVAQEVVRTLVGSIGLIASVPLVTGLAALVVDADGPVGHTHVHDVRPEPIVGDNDPEASLQRLFGRSEPDARED